MTKRDFIIRLSFFIFIIGATLTACTRVVVCSTREYALPCPSGEHPNYLFFVGYTPAEVKTAVLTYYQQDGLFRTKISTVNMSDALEIAQDPVLLSTNVIYETGSNGQLTTTNDWEIKIAGRDVPYRVSGFKYDTKACCKNEERTSAKNLASAVIDGKVRNDTQHIFEFSK